MTSRRGRIHAAYFPLATSCPFQRAYILVATVHKNDMMKQRTVGQRLQITFGHQPLFFKRSRQHAAEATLTAQQVGNSTIATITFGGQRIGKQVERDRLIALHTQRIGHPLVSIAHIAAHQRGLAIEILIILQHHPLHRIVLHVFDEGQTFAHNVPLEGTHRVLIRIHILQRIFIVKQVFGQENIFSGQRLYFQCFGDRNRHNSLRIGIGLVCQRGNKLRRRNFRLFTTITSCRQQAAQQTYKQNYTPHILILGKRFRLTV